MNSLGRAERGGSTAGLKEFHNLLNNVEQTAIEEEGRSWRKYARLVLPHVGLVAFVCLYAIFGAWVFYSIESPHEDRLKVLGIRRVHELRKQMVAQVLASGASADQQQRAQWSQQMEAELSAFSEQLFKAYREQYVRYENVRPTGQQHAQSAQQQPPQTDPRFRRHFSKSRSDGKLWTPSSSLFFAATTMATIGYGNIVPVTNQGRIACIIFALFGAPLTIITIGDLGKFLSESIIWLYRDLREKYEYWGFRVSRFWIARRKKRKRRQMKQGLFDLEQGEVDEEEEEQEQQEQEQEAGGEPQANAAAQRNEQPKSVEDWEEHTDVPVLLVFAILLLYIALGGVLFAVLESWTYMDAFYYCFVSLTTIGFGDLVPDRHEYIVLMLIYLGFGLAVTTMCIDLVGIQYIQKIHYFGRKFQGTDILQILKRKRMLERRFAMGEGKDLFEYVIRQEREALFPSHQQKTLAQPVLHLANQALARDQPEEEKLSLRSDEPIVPTEEAQVLDVLPLQGLALAQQLCVPELLEPVPIERRVSSPSVLGTPPSETERLIMYEQLRREGRADSWAESGLTPSMASSTASTAPSVRQRQQLYENWRSPQPSLSSFAFTFPPPSPDLAEIAEAARASRRLASCPEILPQPSCFAPIHLPVDLVPFAELAFAPLVLDLSPSPPPPEPHPSAPEMPVPQQAEESVIEDPHPTSVEDTLPPIQRAAAMHEHIAESAGDASTQAKVAQRLLPAHIPSEMLDVSSAELRRLSPKQYVQEQLHLLLPDPYQAHSDEAGEAHLEAAAAQLSESDRQMHLAASEQRPSVVAAARQMEAEQPLFSELEKFFAEEEQEHLVLAEVVGGGAEEAEEQPLFDIDLGAFELVDSGITAEELLTNEDPVIYHKDMPVHSVHHDTVQTEAAIANLMNAPQSMLSTQVPPTMVADNYCFAVDADRIQMADIMGDEHWWRHTSRPTKYFYSKDLRRFYRVNCLAARGKILSARLANTTPAMGGGQCTAEMMGPELGSCSGESFSTGSFARRSITFGAGGTSEGRPSIAPSVLSPPLVQPAGSSSSAFPMPSSSLHAPHLPSIGGPSPRGSIAAFSQHQMQQQQQQMMAQWRQCPDAQRGEIVDLGDVYRVVRFYSFWRTCTSFHRIVTMIERVGFSSSSLVERSSSQPRLNRPPSSEQPHTLPPSSTVSESSSSAAAKSMSRFGSARSVPDFQKRLFVQYLWRNAKASDKARVQREFDPRRQRLLRFVPTDPNARKKMTSAKAQWRNSSTGQSMEKQSKFSHLTPPTSATMPGYGSPSSSVRWRVPPQEAAERARSPASGGRPQSTPISPLRRAKTSADVSPR